MNRQRSDMVRMLDLVMTKRLFAFVAAATVGLLLAGQPVRAGELVVPDPADDATGLAEEVRSSPRPSDPELDILEVRYGSTATELRIDLKINKVGIPQGSQGFTYRVRFGHGGSDWEFLYQVLDVPGFNQPLFTLRPGGAEGSQESISCRCSGKINGRTATLEIRAEIKSLSRAIRAYDSDAPPIQPGTKLERLTNVTDRLTAFLLIPSDWAEPPAGATFTI